MRRALFVLLLPAAVHAGQPERTILAANGLTADGASLGGYLRTLRLSDRELAAAAEDVRDLGSRSPATRHDAILRLGVLRAPPLAALREATASLDPEVRRIATRLLEEAVLRIRRELLVAVLRTISDETVTGLAEDLLGIAPLAAEMRLAPALAGALRATLRDADLPLLREAAARGDLETRCVAVRALGAAPGAGADEAAPCLAAEDERLRLAGALALADRGDRRCLPVLLALLAADGLAVRRDAADALRAARGGGEGFDAFAAPDSRREAAAEWRKWLEAQPDAPWEHPLPLGRRLLGRTLVSLFAEGRLVELDEEGKRTFEVSGLPRPWAVQGLPNGHRLVVLLGQQALIEYDATGAETARLRVPGQPHGFQRLENGNTLVAVPEQECVLELRPDGGIASQLAVRGMPVNARLLDNGRYLVCLARPPQVVEVERGGAVVWSVAADLRFPSSAQRLENGNTLVVDAGSRAVEFDTQGHVVWEMTGLQQCYSAQRLPDGSTLVADRAGVREIAPDGKERWLLRTTAFSRASRY